MALNKMTALGHYPNMVSVTQALSLLESTHNYSKSIEIFRTFVASEVSKLSRKILSYNQILVRTLYISADKFIALPS